MISKTVLSTAVTLALSAGFVSAQSISANGTFDSTLRQAKLNQLAPTRSSMHSATKMKNLRWLSMY